LPQARWRCLLALGQFLKFFPVARALHGDLRGSAIDVPVVVRREFDRRRANRVLDLQQTLPREPASEEQTTKHPKKREAV
jgi:hypothetical protein